MLPVAWEGFYASILEAETPLGGVRFKLIVTSELGRHPADPAWSPYSLSFAAHHLQEGVTLFTPAGLCQVPAVCQELGHRQGLQGLGVSEQIESVGRTRAPLPQASAEPSQRTGCVLRTSRDESACRKTAPRKAQGPAAGDCSSGRVGWWR